MVQKRFDWFSLSIPGLVFVLGCAVGLRAGLGRAPHTSASLAADEAAATVPLAPRVALFLSMNCACSNDQLLEFAPLVQRFRRLGFRFDVYGLNESASSEERVDYERALGIGIPMQWSGSEAMATQLKVDRTPFAIVWGDDGSERYRGGLRAPDEAPLLKPALEAVAAGRDVLVPIGKSIGCARRLTFRPVSDRR